MERVLNRNYVLCGDVEFLYCLPDMYSGLFDIILNTIEEGALINYEAGQVLEELSKGRDAVCYFGELAVALVKFEGWLGVGEGL